MTHAPTRQGRIHRAIQPIVAMLLVTLLSACGAPEHPLKIGSNQWPGYEPVYLARELGHLDPHQVKLVELLSSSDVMQNLRDGVLDGGMLTLDEVITLLGEGLDLRVVLVMDVSNGADTVLSQPEIKTLDDIRGRRIGVELSALGALMLESLLDAAHLKRNEVKLVNLTVDRQDEAFLLRQIDVLITFEPLRSRLLANGANELFSSRRIPGRIVDVLAVRGDVLGDHGEQLRTLTQAYFLGLKQLREHPKDNLPRIAPRLGMPVKDLKTAYTLMTLPDVKANRDWLAPPGRRLEQSAARLADLMRRWRLIDGAPDIHALADPDFLPQP